MTIGSVSLKISAVIASGTVVLQSSMTPPMESSMSSFLVPVVSAVVGGAMSYAMLKTTVQKMEADVREMRNDIGEVYALLRDSMTKIAHMEGRLTIHHHHKEP